MNSNRLAVLLGGLLLAFLVAGRAQASTSYIWNNTSVDYWTNNASWNPASGYPGGAAGDNAYLTNSVAGAYTNILDFSPANSINTLAISNALGQARLVITNAVLTNATLILGNGGVLELDGYASLLTTNAVILPASSRGSTSLVTSAGAVAGIWNLNNTNNLLVGHGGAMTGNVLTINAAIITNAYQAYVGDMTRAVGNLLVITNGGQLWTASSSYIGGNNVQYTSNNWVVVAGGGAAPSLWNAGGALITVDNIYARGDGLLIDGAGVMGGATVTNVGTLKIGDGGGFANLPTGYLIVTNGGQLYCGKLTIGNYGMNCLALVSGGAARSLVNASGAISVGPAGLGTNNLLRIDGLGVAGGAVITNGNGLTLGNSCNAHSLIITNGGQLWTTNTSYIGEYAGSSNRMVVAGGGTGGAVSVWDNGNALLYVGYQTGTCTGNVLQIDGVGVVGGAVVTNVSALGVGVFDGILNSVIVTNGGQLWTKAGTTYIGSSTHGSNSLLVVGGGSGGAPALWNAGAQTITVGSRASIGGILRIDGAGVAGGAVVTNVGGIHVGDTEYQPVTPIGHSLIVTNGGQLWMANAGGALSGASNTVTIIGAGSLWNLSGQPLTDGSAGNTGNVVAVLNGGVLESGSLVTGTGVGNIITNAGGVYQFNTASPTLTPGATGSIAIASGTISFRAITNADVFCNQTNSPATHTLSTNKMLWLGSNTFCLNAATNIAGGQAYTFGTASGTATNFAALELMNGATYRGGAVTIGSGGTLLVTNGANTIASNLVMASGSILALDLGKATNSSLTVLGNADCSGAALQVGLNAAPPVGFSYPILTATGVCTNFSARSVTLSFGGTNYVIVVKRSSNGIVLVNAPGGTGVFFH